jgi:D-alanine-D-alanine ligase
LEAKITKIAIDAFGLLNCKSLARVDFLVEKKGMDYKIILNEVNTLPGFTKISMFSNLFVQKGIPYSKLLDILIDGAVR